MEQKISQEQKKKRVLKMGKEIEHHLKRTNNTLSAKLAVRESQYRIAIEGLKAINEFGDISVALKTIEAMFDCVPTDS